MNSNPKLSYAIAAILSGSGSGAGVAYAAPASATDASDAIQEITVTAQRRTESIQNVPITITALTAETLVQLNVTVFDDYVKFLPNVTVANQGPGQGQIYMRGLATTQDGEQSSGATGSFPNVAVYLDEQSAQLPGRNLDVYAADIERVEVLEGPQGTLYGAGAQAGVIRYITNKPQLNKTEANFNGGYGYTSHGDPSSSLDATINLPLIDDKLAVRAVIYNESRGGYIDNVPGTFTRKSTDLGIGYYFKGVVPAINQVASNSQLAGRAINPVTYKGMRVSGLYQFNSEWNLLVAQSYQNMEADGIFAQMPYGSDGQKLPDLSVNLFSPQYDKDRFSNTAWTLNGRLGALKAVYTGGYLVRKVDQVADYTNYNRGAYGDYYSCILPGTRQAIANGTPGGACLSPVANFRVQQRNTHQNHEFRLSTPDDWRVRAIGGLFWEDFLVQDISDWYYRAPGAGFVPLIAPAASSANNHAIRDPLIGFYDDIQRGYQQKAAFASVDFDIIPKVLTVTAGTRYYNMDTFEKGAKGGSYGCREGGLYQAKDANGKPIPVASPCDSGLNLDTLVVPAGNGAYSDKSVGLEKTYKGFKSRANVSWKFTDDGLLYYTWSQGFRPGGFNRASGFVSAGQSPLKGIFLTPIGFAPDVLTNNELGFKTQWLNHRLQVNGTYYREDWKSVQIGEFDPGVLGNLTFTTNGPDYRVKGFETEVVGRVLTGLTVTLAGAWNHSELVSTPGLKDKNGVPIVWSNYKDANGNPLHNPYGDIGSPLAQSPSFQGNVRVRYEFPQGDYHGFVQGAAAHPSHELSTTDRLATDNSVPPRSVAYDLPGFTTYDLSFGIARDAWNVQVYGTNITDSRGAVFSTYAQRVKEDTVIRPRTVMLKIGYKFGGQ
ncbi:MAG: TonB-dependent receptor [Pseudomonadota bacterium]|nr:TonB-dependent receptor [Pseudomonadota bacterium]